MEIQRETIKYYHVKNFERLDNVNSSYRKRNSKTQISKIFLEYFQIKNLQIDRTEKY